METIAGSARMPPGSRSVVNMSDVAYMLKLEKKRYMRRIRQMENTRRNYELRWKEIRDYELPYVGDFDSTNDETNPARRRDLNIYNGAAWEANTIFAAGIMSGLTPPNRQWFRLSFANQALTDNSDAAQLLDQRQDIMNNVLNKSNFYNAVHSSYLELAFGQAPLGIFPDRETGVHFSPYTVGSYYMESGPDGMINTFCRKCTMTTQQLADKFGIDALPENIRNELKADSSSKHKLFWYVEPNRMADPQKLGRFFMPYLSVYWLEESREDEWLYIGGFYEWPVPVGRYLVSNNDAYGKGPGWFAEGDAKELNILEKDKLMMVEMLAKPPMVSDENTANSGIDLVPGGNTVVASGGRIEPLLDLNPNLQHVMEVIAEDVDRIKRHYSSDLFLMLDQMEDKQMTAREVIERSQEKMQQLGPVVQRMQFEFLSKIIERVYNILDRAGVFPQPDNPELMQVIAQEEIKIDYISPLAQAQKMSGMVNIEQAIQFVGQLAQFDPGVLDKVNFTEAIDRYFDMVGAPASIKRSDDEYQAIQAQKQQEQARQQAEQQAMMAVQAAAPAAQAAKNATEAANDGNPALQQLMGMNDMGSGLINGE